MRQVEDYTNAFLVSFYVLVLMALITVWAIFTFPAALFAAVCAYIPLSRRKPPSKK